MALRSREDIDPLHFASVTLNLVHQETLFYRILNASKRQKDSLCNGLAWTLES
jgi:hypothetical protein